MNRLYKNPALRNEIKTSARPISRRDTAGTESTDSNKLLPYQEERQLPPSLLSHVLTW